MAVWLDADGRVFPEEVAPDGDEDLACGIALQEDRLGGGVED